MSSDTHIYLDYEGCATLLAATLRLALHDAILGNAHSYSAICLLDEIAPYWRTWPRPRSPYILFKGKTNILHRPCQHDHSHTPRPEAIAHYAAQEGPGAFAGITLSA